MKIRHDDKLYYPVYFALMQLTSAVKVIFERLLNNQSSLLIINQEAHGVVRKFLAKCKYLGNSRVAGNSVR